VKAKELLIDNHRVLIDLEDWPVISRFDWFINKCNPGTYYAYSSFFYGKKSRIMAMHRLITGFRCGLVDHINGNGLDNRKSNLRVCTASQNQMNKKKYQRKKPTTSIYKGVFLEKRSGQWIAYIRKNKKSIRIGMFKSEALAAKAYDEAAIEHFGEYASLNFKQKEMYPLETDNERI
jgi:hypothetical protein